jgi:hypothetical protein
MSWCTVDDARGASEDVGPRVALPAPAPKLKALCRARARARAGPCWSVGASRQGRLPFAPPAPGVTRARRVPPPPVRLQKLRGRLASRSKATVGLGRRRDTAGRLGRRCLTATCPPKRPVIIAHAAPNSKVSEFGLGDMGGSRWSFGLAASRRARVGFRLEAAVRARDYSTREAAVGANGGGGRRALPWLQTE